MMTLDSSKNGVAGRITIIAAAVGILITMLGGVYNLSNSVSEVNQRLDRNLAEIQRSEAIELEEIRDHCAVLRQLDIDLRFHIIKEGSRPTQSIKISC